MALNDEIKSLKLSPLAKMLVLALVAGGTSFNAFAAESKEASDIENVTSTPQENVSDSQDMTQFNTDVMDVKDRENIDISHFSRKGYVMPGDYPLTLNVNNTDIREVNVTFAPLENDPQGSYPCLTSEMVKLFGLKDDTADKLKWVTHGGEVCLDQTSLSGMTAIGDLTHGALRITIPQAYLEYSAPDWDPPSRWDDGVTGLLFDYNFNYSKTEQHQGNNSNNISGNGVTGANFGPWRLRADWQAQRNSRNGQTEQNWQWSRYYMYRALPKLGAKLTLGETDLDSGLFDSFRFAGANLATDDSMLPPNLQGYAPEVSGVARSNAKVTISQQGRVIYQSQVAAGPFRIQELSQAVSGKLDVKVEEQDGSEQNFQVDTASIPYLTRPGMIRYKLSGGRPTDWKHRTEDVTFGTGEFSWGVSNGWSLFGGVVATQQYNALAMGVGRDLMAFGAVSLDATHSQARLPGEDVKSGNSYRLSYSKRFDEIDSQVTFAGYRFSERDFMSMNNYLDARYSDMHHDGLRIGRSKELYTITVNKQFKDVGLSIYGNYSRQTYWDQPDNDIWSLSMAKYMDVGSWKNISLNLTGYKNRNNNIRDEGVYASISIPWSSGGYLTYSGESRRNGNTHSLGWSDSMDANDSYSLRTSIASDEKKAVSGYLTHRGDIARTNLTASYQEGAYSSVGMSVQGGATATLHGAALHRSSSPGAARVMLDTNGVSDVPVRSSGGDIHSNVFGKAVVADVNSYWRGSAGVNVNALGADMDVSHPLTQFTLTEGAIGYRKLDVMSGRKMMAMIKFADGSSPAFGSTVMRDGHEVGVVDEDGSVWLTGIRPGSDMSVLQDNDIVCTLTIPGHLPEDASQLLLLPCNKRDS